MAEIRALVVDNSPVIRKIVSYVLEAEGCIVQIAEDGLEALDCISQHRPDVIFTDLIMPKIDGEKLCYIIRNTKELEDLFLVVLSGVAMEDDDNTLRIGADVCIAKGPAATMTIHIKAALEKFRTNQRKGCSIEGMEGLYSREVTRELLVIRNHQELVLAKMSEGVVELNHAGRIVMANSAAVELLALPQAQVLGRSLAQLVSRSAGERMEDWLAQLAAPDCLQPLLFTYEDPVQLEDRQVICNLVPMAEDDTFFIVGILQDVSRRKALEQRQRQLEKELQRIQKLDAMSLMASGIAHDFNNLLTIINGNVEMARYICRDDKVSSLLSETAKALDLTVQLIRQFTTFSNTYLPQKSQVRLRSLIDDVLQQDLAGTSISSHLSIGEEELAINLDPALVRQVFTNLSRNAVDAMRGAGRIDVTMDRVDGTEEAAKTGQPIASGDFVRIAFQDSGPGIDLRHLDQVFDPYFSTKQKGAQKGMGLGLTIVHSIVKKHGGFVWIDSPSDGGCRVYLYFPVSEGIVSDPRFIAGKGHGRQVLVMDDEEMMRLINKKMFEHYGCEVTLAINGEEAVALYQEKLESGDGFDLVLLDLWVNDGMGGLEAARRITALDPEATMVAISGDSGSEPMLRYAEYDFVAALAKPFSIDLVEDLVNRFL
jgi:signal transduction histidine kinase/DNA-binding NarL/FixJ family response regulator